MHQTAPPEVHLAAGDNRLLNMISRRRGVLFALVAVLAISTFNGQWRVGRDSAAYRGLGHQLASSGKYLFRDRPAAAGYADQHDTRYPGLPMLLAGVEGLFGTGDAAPVALIFIMGGATLLLTYALLKPKLPAWLAVAATVGVGINGHFLEHANEILSDAPFLMGVMVVLLAFDRLTCAINARGRTWWAIALALGLIFAASMRPTFWVLAVALGLASLWGIMRPGGQGPARRRTRIACGVTLAMLALASLAFVLVLDLRGRQAAGYEGKLANRFSDIAALAGRVPLNLHEMLEQTLPESFFGTQLGPGFIPFCHDVTGKKLYKLGLSSVFSLLLIGAGIALARRNVLWGVLVGATIVTMAVIGSVPRYFIMILPLLLAGWGLLIADLARRAARWQLSEVVAFAGLGVVIFPNLVQCADLFREQRGLLRPKQGLAHVGFTRAYHGGKWAGVYDVAKMIQQNVPAGQKVIGPEATVLTFLSDRDVFGLGMLLPRRDRGGVWERKIRRMKSELQFAIFPDPANKLYDDKDQLTWRLIRTGMLRPTRTVAQAGGYKLCEFEVVHVGRHKSTKNRAAATQLKRRKSPGTLSTKPATAPAALPSSREARSATTSPATMPATTQRSGKRRRPATQPTSSI